MESEPDHTSGDEDEVSARQVMSIQQVPGVPYSQVLKRCGRTLIF